MKAQLYSAARYGRGNVPIWAVALQLSEAWGIPPWDVMAHPQGVRWAARYAAWKQAESQAREMMERER